MFMDNCLSRARPVLLTAITLSLIALSGCTADRYFMVPKEDLKSVESSVDSQRATLVTMENNATLRHNQILSNNRASTQTILEAIETKVTKPNCPPPEAAPKCPAQETDKGRADRLKGKLIVGELEKFYLAGPGLVYNARIDSGAETSSMHARNIKEFERDGNSWVRFEVPVPGTEGEEWVPMEKEVARRVRIIQASTDEGESRFVVDLQFAIGDHHQTAEFTLADRENLTYDALVGRNILRDVMLIDVGKEFATELPESYTRKQAADGEGQ